MGLISWNSSTRICENAIKDFVFFAALFQHCDGFKQDIVVIHDMVAFQQRAILCHNAFGQLGSHQYAIFYTGNAV